MGIAAASSAEGGWRRPQDSSQYEYTAASLMEVGARRRIAIAAELIESVEMSLRWLETLRVPRG